MYRLDQKTFSAFPLLIARTDSQMDLVPTEDPPQNPIISQNDTVNEDNVRIAATALQDMRLASSHPIATSTPPPPGQFHSKHA
jgi:hypothetical protein